MMTQKNGFMGLKFKLGDNQRRRFVYERGEGWTRRCELSVGMTMWLLERKMPFFISGLPSAVVLGHWRHYFLSFPHTAEIYAWRLYRPLRAGLWRQFRIRLPRWDG